MADRDIFDIEMSPGMQPSSGIGDRILVVIAGIALFGGLAIAVTNVILHGDETAQSSATPSATPSKTPVPVPTPAPPRVATLVEPDVEIVQPSQQPSFSGWIRASADLDIRVNPEPDATTIGVLAKGEIIYADQQEQPSVEPGWLFLQQKAGWIASVSGGEQVVERYEWPRYRSGGSISSIAASPDGFLAMVGPAAGPDVYQPPTPAVSTDGARWRSAGSSAFEGWDTSSVAWGPAGWLAVSYVSDWEQSRIWIWGSADGLRWTRLGMMAGVNDEYPGRLVASSRGYLFETYPQRGYGGSGTILWSSADGRTWTESKSAFLSTSGGERRIEGLAGGFYLWDPGGDPAMPASAAAFSLDGQHWTKVANGPGGANLHMTTHSDRILAIDLDPTTLVARVWSGAIVRGQVLWRRLPDGDDAFAGGIVTQLVSDSTQAYAFGWDRANDAPLVWAGDGTSWTRSQLPASFKGVPGAAAAGPTGVVVVGHRPSLRGDNPIVWHRTPTGGWLPESDPILALVPDPQANDCPPLPTNFAAFTVVDAAAMIVCHGAEPTTFRAWSNVCDQCYDTTVYDVEPAWLVRPTTNMLFLSPIDWEDAGSQSLVLSPSLTIDPSWARAWLEVTGHFDDPAAPSCHMEPMAYDLPWFSGQQSVIDQCRMTFVVTDVKVVSGPS
jgi:hypothetical protein